MRRVETQMGYENVHFYLLYKILFNGFSLLSGCKGDHFGNPLHYLPCFEKHIQQRSYHERAIPCCMEEGGGRGGNGCLKQIGLYPFHSRWQSSLSIIIRQSEREMEILITSFRMKCLINEFFITNHFVCHHFLLAIQFCFFWWRRKVHCPLLHFD